MTVFSLTSFGTPRSTLQGNLADKRRRSHQRKLEGQHTGIDKSKPALLRTSEADQAGVDSVKMAPRRTPISRDAVKKCTECGYSNNFSENGKVRFGKVKIKSKGTFLYNGLTSPRDCSKRFKRHPPAEMFQRQRRMNETAKSSKRQQED